MGCAAVPRTYLVADQLALSPEEEGTQLRYSGFVPLCRAGIMIEGWHMQLKLVISLVQNLYVDRLFREMPCVKNVGFF